MTARQKGSLLFFFHGALAALSLRFKFLNAEAKKINIFNVR